MKTFYIKHLSVSVSDTDWEKVQKHTWYVSYRGRKKQPYVMGSVDGQMVHLHRFILDLTDPEVWVDHKDRNPLNNTRENLRVLPAKKFNTYNRSKSAGAKSRFVGVCWSKNMNRWMSRIQFNGKSYVLGYFHSERAAALIRQRVARKLFGVYAPENHDDFAPHPNTAASALQLPVTTMASEFNRAVERLCLTIKGCGNGDSRP